jgi:hypothetical protein
MAVRPWRPGLVPRSEPPIATVSLVATPPFLTQRYAVAPAHCEAREGHRCSLRSTRRGCARRLPGFRHDRVDRPLPTSKPRLA